MTEISIYKGKDFVSIKKKQSLSVHIKRKHSQKVIAFDLDETLGSFGELYILWQGITEYYKLKGQIQDMDVIFREVLDLYPEFLRHGILNILGYLYSKKKSGQCSKVFLYTNNQCYGTENSKWLSYIIGYIHQKLCSPSMVLFDKIICAFKINNQIIEPLRTSHNKTYSDFIRCSLLPKSAEICFIDNSYYDKMVNNRVYYIQPRYYYHMLSKSEILNRLPKLSFAFDVDVDFVREWFSKYYIGSQKRNLLSVDIRVSQKIMYHVKEFFLLSTKGKQTKKLTVRLGKFTRKSRT
jgi:hypothetical protein